MTMWAFGVAVLIGLLSGFLLGAIWARGLLSKTLYALLNGPVLSAAAGRYLPQQWPTFGSRTRESVDAPVWIGGLDPDLELQWSTAAMPVTSRASRAAKVQALR